MDGLDEEIMEVERLLSLTTRQFVRTRLVLLLSDLQQEKRRRDLALSSLQLAVTGALPVFRNVQRAGEAPGLGQLDAMNPSPLQALRSQAPIGNPLVEGLQGIQPNPGLHPVTQVDAMGYGPIWAAAGGQHRQFSGRSDMSDGGAFAPALASPTALVNPLGAALANPWPYGLKSAAAGPGDPFRVLTTCSWEQSDTMVKVYVPLRGVQTDMLRPTFTSNSVEVKVYDLHGKNYIFTLSPTYQPINEEGCMAVASKTRKNILVTMQKLHSFTPDERHWRDLYGDRSQMPAMLA